jgi:hypothetical protein
MPTLFERWQPITSDFGFIRAPIEDVVAEVLKWTRSNGIQYVRSEITSSFEDALQSLLPLSYMMPRELFVQAKSGWVAFFRNGLKGADPFGPMSYLAKLLHVESMRVCSTAKDVMYPATIWELYGPEDTAFLNYRRAITAANDGGRWVFLEAGDRFPFERVEAYTLKRKRDRFTRDMLIDYLRHFQVDAFSEDFYLVSAQSPAIKLQQCTNLVQCPEYSLEEVATGVPWRRKT